MSVFVRAIRACILTVVCLTLIPGGVFAQDPYIAALRQINPQLVQRHPPLRIDDEVLAANGIRKIAGRHLTVYTDVRDRPDVDQLTVVFDLAVDQWCQYFSIDPARAAVWHMRAFVIQDKQRFQRTGSFPADLTDFLAGYQRGSEMWVYLQPGDYYTRHLLLHEGTHAFMDWFLGGFGSPWYSEGIAERLGLNRWDGQDLQLGYHVNDRTESEYWGRVKVLRGAVEQGTVLSLDEVLQIPNLAFRKVESYAWAWAACEFLENHSLSKQVFAELCKQVKQSGPRFNRGLRQALKKQWAVLQRDFYLFVNEVDYGYDVGKSRLISAGPAESSEGMSTVKIRADHGWQRTTLAVMPGDKLHIRSSSRYQVGTTQISDQTSVPWPCEANGITLEYYRGRPLGMLLAGVYDPMTAGEVDKAGIEVTLADLLNPLEVGNDSVIQITKPGVLCLRVNDSPARMQDNAGVLEVTIEELK